MNNQRLKKSAYSAIFVSIFCLGTAVEVKAQFLDKYETGIIELTVCNDRTSKFDTKLIKAVAFILRMKILAITLLLLSGVAIVKSAAILKIIIFLFIGFSGVQIVYEKAIASHISQAKAFSTLMQNQTRPSLSNDGAILEGPIAPVGDITDPPTNSDPSIILPPPPPLLNTETPTVSPVEELSDGSSISCE